MEVEPHYMDRFLNQNFSVQCSKDRYCFRCNLGFCSHCCPNHWAHHQPQAPHGHVSRIRSSGGRMMINWEDSKGVGYDWRKIQWVNSGGLRWMYLQRPQDHLPENYPYRCTACDDKRKANFEFCAINCKSGHINGANGIALATNLLATEWEHVECDTYCTRCRKAFSSALCSDHVEVHHQNQAAATIEIFHHQGWALVAADQAVLPAFVFQGVQVIEVNGVAMHPIRSRALQLQVPPVADWMHPCAGSCVEGVPLGAQFCSVHCHLRR